MIKPNNELCFSMSDLYPNWGGLDTSQLAVPEEDDLVALNESEKVAEESKVGTASTKNIIIAIIVFIALTIFFGGK